MPYFLKQNSRYETVSTGVCLTEKSLQILQLESFNNRHYISVFRRFFITNNPSHHKLICKKIKNLSLVSSKVTLVIPDSLTLRKNIKVSKKLNTQDLAELARVESKKYMPNDLDDMCFDYSLAEYKDQEGYYTMLIVAARSSVIKTKISFLNTLGLEVRNVDVESNCILRVVSKLLDKVGMTIAWFDISENTVKSFVFQNKDVIFLNEDKYSKSTTQTNLSEIYTKIELSLLYYFASSAASPIEIIYLSGSYPQLVSLSQMLAMKKNIPVNILDNLVPTDTEFKLSKSVMALGMSLLK